MDSRRSVSTSKQAEYDSLELEHIVGYTGRYQNTIHYLPTNPNFYIYTIGGLVVIEDVADKHNQKFLRGHDMQVCSLAISPSSRLIASGQLGTAYARVPEAPILLWDLRSMKILNTFKGLKGSVCLLSFSPDDKFLAATGDNNTFVIWNTEDYCVVFNRVYESPMTAVHWGLMRKDLKHPSYVLITANASNLFVNSLEFDLATMQYNLKAAPCQLPSSGLIRTYTCSYLDPATNNIFVGTSGGELAIFNITNRIFKAILPVSSNGVLSVTGNGESIFIGAGDGRLRKLRGAETKWAVESEIILEGKVVALTLAGDKMIAGTSAGKIYQVHAQTLTTTEISESHIDSINDIHFRKDRLDIFSTIDNSGIVRVWDLNELFIITRCSSGTTARPKGVCVCIADDNTVVSGWEDGSIRCFEISNKKFSALRWEISNGHKGPVTSLYIDENIILSGGADGIVRVWSRKAHTLITQISIHKKDVVKIFPDLLKPNIIHSASVDKIIHSYDLRTDKKVVLHQAKNGLLCDMTQRKDHENELSNSFSPSSLTFITCGGNTPIQFWDIDVTDPVDSIDYPYKLQTIQISPSGKYLALGSETSEAFLGKYIGHSGPVNKLFWTPDEKQIISVGADASMCIWNFYGA